MRQARKFLALPGAERRLLADAALLICAARLGLWLLPFRLLPGLLARLARLTTPRTSTALSTPNDRTTTHSSSVLGPSPTAEREEANSSFVVRPWSLVVRRSSFVVRPSSIVHRPSPSVVAPDRIAWAVVVVSSYVPAASCLTQALAAQALLARRGCPAQLQIGVARGAHGQLEAHAWVEVAGQAILGGSIRDRYIPLSSSEKQTL
jgi:hypothetical protein